MEQLKKHSESERIKNRDTQIGGPRSNANKEPT